MFRLIPNLLSPGEKLCAPPQSCNEQVSPCGLLPGTALSPGLGRAWGAGAVVSVHHMPTLVTLDRAAPVEFAVTAAGGLGSPLFHLQPTLGAQAPAAASLPPGGVVAVLQALTALSALDAQAGIAGAVIWRLL